MSPFVSGRRVLLAGLLFVVAAVSAVSAAEPVFPGETWQTADPRERGWSMSGLRKARRYFREMGSTALLIVQDGRIVVAWGDTRRR